MKNRRTTFCRGVHEELTAPKWLDSVEKEKRRSNLNFSKSSTNFVAMATNQNSKNNVLQFLSWRTAGRPKHIWSIWHTRRLMGDVFEKQPKFAEMSLPQQQGSAQNIVHGSIESAIPENPLLGANISGLSAIQAELQAIFVQILGSQFGRQGA